jgi:hypothetical protein
VIVRDDAPETRMANSHYVVPFHSLMRQIGLEELLSRSQIRMSREQFEALMRAMLRYVAVDEAWYRDAYPDVDQAIRNGKVRSAKDHFVASGYFEGRKCGRVLVDEKWYLTEYPDVAEGVELGEFMSAQQHFDSHGEKEGRLPHPL